MLGVVRDVADAEGVQRPVLEELVGLLAQRRAADLEAPVEAVAVGLQLQDGAQHLAVVVLAQEAHLVAGRQGGVEGAGEDDVPAQVLLGEGGDIALDHIGGAVRVALPEGLHLPDGQREAVFLGQ